MSGNTDDSRRTRRRAVRTAGPPVEEATAEAVTVKVSAAAPVGTRKAAAEPGGAEAKDSAVDIAAPASALAGGAKASASDDATSTEATEATVAAKPLLAEAAVPETPRADETVPAEKTVALSESSDDSGAQADAEAAKAGDGESTGFGLRGIVLVAAAAVLVAALIAGAVISAFTVRSIDRQADRRTAYVQTAEQAILNLTTINADTAAEDIDRILSLASGKFKNEFDGRVDPFLSIVQQAQVRATGEVVEAALESEGEDSAMVLVAAKQNLTNAGQEGPQTRHYRFRVTVTESDSGLTASNVEFVP